MSINDLYAEIEKLNKQIENEPKRLLKRKYELEDELKELDDKIKYAGLHGDFSSVGQYKSQKARLIQKKAIDQTPELKSQIKKCKKEIIDRIVEYYEENKTINDIIKIEDISREIYEEWFNFSNFGNETGYLFIDQIEHDEFNWTYSNPINEVKFYSHSLDELKEKIRYKNEILLIFNNDLAEQAEKRDSIIYQKSINKILRELDNSNVDDAQNIFDSLKSYEDNFNETQIIYLCEIMGENIKLCSHTSDFFQILELNKEVIDKQIYNEVYQKSIDNLLINSEDNNLFSNLIECADKFNKVQLINLFDTFSNKEYISDYFDEFNYILSVNDDKINSEYVDRCYKRIIDNRLEKLNGSEEYVDLDNIFEDLSVLGEKFSKNQLNKLYDLVIAEDYISNYYDEFNHILEVNKSKFDGVIDEVYHTIIDIGLDKLKNSNLNYSETYNLFRYLNFFSIRFSKEQLDNLSSLMINNVMKSNMWSLYHVLETNEDKFGLDCDKIYSSIIKNRLNLLKNIDSNNDIDEEYIMDNLRIVRQNFSFEQLNELITIIITNTNLCNFADDFKVILDENIDKLQDLNLKEVYVKVIETRIKELNDLPRDSIKSCLFSDLVVFSNFFSKDQIYNLLKIIKDKNLVIYLNNDLIYLFKNKIHRFDKEIDNVLIEIIIDYKLNKLEKLNFGFSDAKYILGSMREYVNNFSKSQITRLCHISMNNRQVYNCYICENNLKFLLEKNKDKINDDLYKQTLIKCNIDV